MSLVAVLGAPDGLVMAADSRMTKGYDLEGPKTRDDSEKFVQVAGGHGLLTYGLMEAGHLGIKTVQKEYPADLPGDFTIGRLLEFAADSFKNASESWGAGNPEVLRNENDLGFILAGYDKDRESPGIFHFMSPRFIPEEIKGNFILAGQWLVAKYCMMRLYRTGMSMDDLKDLAVFMFDATMSVDSTVGGTINMATLDKGAGYRRVTAAEISSIRENNEGAGLLFRELFHSALVAAAAGREKMGECDSDR